MARILFVLWLNILLPVTNSAHYILLLYIFQDVMKQKLGQCKTESTWLGSSWMCRKRRTHYQSFCRNGAVISVSTIPHALLLLSTCKCFHICTISINLSNAYVTNIPLTFAGSRICICIS